MELFLDHRSFSKFILKTEQQYKDKAPDIFNERYFLQDFPRSQGVLFIGKCPIEAFINYENSTLWTDEEKKIKSDLFFKKLFQEFKISNQKQWHYERFIRLFLHQSQYHPHAEYINSNPGLKEKFFIGKPPFYSNFTTYSRCKITLSLDDSAIHIKQEHTYHTLHDKFCHIIKAVNPNEDFLIRGTAIYKIEFLPTIEKKWIAKYGLVSSNIECKEEYKSFLDTRSILEKIIDFLTALIKRIATNLNLNKFINSNPTIKSKPIFFISKDGESLHQELVNPNKKLFMQTNR